MSVHLSQLTAQRLPRVSLHKGWQQVLREPNAVLDLQGLADLQDEFLPDLDGDMMDEDQRQDPNDPPQAAEAATPAQPAKLETEVKVEEAKVPLEKSLEESLELEMEETYPDACFSPDCEVIEAIVKDGTAGTRDTDKAEVASGEKNKSAEPSSAKPAVEESKQAEAIAVVETLPQTAASQEAEKTDSGVNDNVPPAPGVPTEKSAEPAKPAVEEPKQAEAITVVETLPQTAPSQEAEKTDSGVNDNVPPAPGVPTEKSAEPAKPAVEEPKQAEAIAVVETLPQTTPSEEAEKTGNGVNDNVPPAPGVPTEKSAEPAKPAVEEPKQAEAITVVETLPQTAPSQEAEKTDSGVNDNVPPAPGVPTEKSGEPAKPAVEEPKQAEDIAVVETLPQTTPSEEAEKTGNGVNDSVPPAPGVPTEKSAEPSAKPVEKGAGTMAEAKRKGAEANVGDESAQQGLTTRKWGWRQERDRDGKNEAEEAEVQRKPPPPPPPPSGSMMPPPPPPAKKAAKKKDIRDSLFWASLGDCIGYLNKAFFFVVYLLIDRTALTSQVWLLTGLLHRQRRRCVHLQLSQARFARSESE